MKVVILRLDHRFPRDGRVTTHTFLTARAFGADKIIYSGQRDEQIEERIKKVTETWGGAFQVEFEKDWQKTVIEWKKQRGEVIHLTVYGLPISEVISHIRTSKLDKMIIIGGAKVPRIVYDLSDWNISITSQPHSEISALSVFLYELLKERMASKIFDGAKLKVIPQLKGKEIRRI
ncbi:MAG: tRNA (cytidine(56)-2'-O)-methyltransferase [Candidatus Bathyarchaeota archaeon]|nr:MAG: tRNA (cytidine(56)-2'-O)-methyltransferase [Candidatus Bathyarchaeota archaeon]